MLKLAFRSVFRHKFRTGLTLAAIVFGVVGLVLVGGFVEDVFTQLRETTIHSQLGHVQIYRAGYTTLGRRDPYRYLIEDPQQVTDLLGDMPEVEDVLLRVGFSGLANNGRTDLSIIGEGVQPDKEARLGSALTITSGRQLSVNDPYGILLGQGVAKSLGLSPGDHLTLLVNTTDSVLNSLEFEVIGVFRTFSRDYDNRAVRIPLAAGQDLIGTSGVLSVVLSLSATEATDSVAKQLKRQLSPQEYEVRTWDELADFYGKTVDLYRRQFAVLQLIILLMVMLSVANSVNMAVYERAGEFGTLMALGRRGRDIFTQVITENMILGVVGASIGVLLSSILAWAISRVGIPMPPPPNSDVGYTGYIPIVPWVVGIAFVVGVAATLFAALLPAYRVARVPVAEALRQNV